MVSWKKKLVNYYYLSADIPHLYVAGLCRIITFFGELRIKEDYRWINSDKQTSSKATDQQRVLNFSYYKTISLQGSMSAYRYATKMPSSANDL